MCKRLLSYSHHRLLGKYQARVNLYSCVLDKNWPLLGINCGYAGNNYAGNGYADNGYTGNRIANPVALQF